MALFVLSYARKDGEALVRKFFDRLCVDLAVMYPQEKEVGFMDTEGIATGATWQETLGGKLESSPVLVPVFSPSFFASEQCGREVQAILERIRVCAAGQAATAVTPNCILPVIWVWENLAIHPTLRNIHYDNVNYPNRYRSKITGLRMLVDLARNRDQFKTFTVSLAIAINNALTATRLPSVKLDYRILPSAFATPNATVGATGPKSVKFAYLAPSRGELGTVRQHLATYGVEGRDWRAFDPSCPTGIGHLTEGVAASLRMSYDVISLDPQFTSKVEAAQQNNGQVVFVVDTWAAQLHGYDGIFAEVDKEEYRSCPMLVPLNNKDEENRSNQYHLLQTLAKRLPGRAAAGGLAFMPAIVDEYDYQAQLSRALATRQSELVGAMSQPPASPGQGLPNI